MDTEPDPRLEAFDNATPEGKLRLLYILGLGLGEWLQHLEEAIAGEITDDPDDDGFPEVEGNA